MTNCQYSIILFQCYQCRFRPRFIYLYIVWEKIIYFLYVYDKIKSLLVSLFYNNNLISYLIV